MPPISVSGGKYCDRKRMRILQLPGNAGVAVSRMFDLAQPNKVDDLLFAYAGQEFFNFWISGTHDNHFGFCDRFNKIWPQMRKQMGKSHVEKLFVGPIRYSGCTM